MLPKRCARVADARKARVRTADGGGWVRWPPDAAGAAAPGGIWGIVGDSTGIAVVVAV